MSSTTEQSDTFNHQQPQPSGGGFMAGGCLAGCLLAFGLMCVFAICAGGGVYFFVSNQVTKYTSQQSGELPTVDYTTDQLAKLEARIDTFKQAVDQGSPPESDLVLTAEEINALIGKEKDLRGKAFVTIQDGQVSGNVSIPIDAIPGGRDRYFNGAVTFDVSIEAGVLIVTLADAEVNGESVPKAFLDVLSRENLAKDLYKDAKIAEAMRRYETVAIEDDKIVLKVRRAEKTSPQDREDETPGTESEETSGEQKSVR